jgi:hypothetical protein
MMRTGCATSSHVDVPHTSGRLTALDERACTWRSLAVWRGCGWDVGVSLGAFFEADGWGGWEGLKQTTTELNTCAASALWKHRPPHSAGVGVMEGGKGWYCRHVGTLTLAAGTAPVDVLECGD